MRARSADRLPPARPLPFLVRCSGSLGVLFAGCARAVGHRAQADPICVPGAGRALGVGAVGAGDGDSWGPPASGPRPADLHPSVIVSQGCVHTACKRRSTARTQASTDSKHTVFAGSRASLIAQTVKNPPAMQETQVRSLYGEDPLEEGMATHSSILAWRIPWTEEPGRLQSMGSQRVGPKPFSK